MMCLPSLSSGRMDPVTYQPVTPTKGNAIKWALIATIATLAAAIFAAATLVTVGMGIALIATGVGVAPGILQLAGAVMLGLTTIGLGMLAKECILNAHHHVQGIRKAAP